MWYFIYIWHNTFTVHGPSVITVEFLLFVKSQFSTNAQSVHLNRGTFGQVWLLTVVSFQRSRHSCEWFEGHKNTFVKFRFIFSWRSSVLTGKISTGWGRHIFGLYLDNCLLMWTHFLVLVWGTCSWSLSEHFGDILCVNASVYDIRCVYAHSWACALMYTWMRRWIDGCEVVV
jgi:hypothetical protein